MFKEHLNLVHEILDEIIDFGYESLTTTEDIEQHLSDYQPNKQPGFFDGLVSQGSSLSFIHHVSKGDKTI